ncbi:TetR family transcriptional regulator C-terminal domain-containing protein [Streptomyces sp. B21-101]|nr:TetR family transcriptional regulator C-terminal domain-containing protein [Streptomyces sp. Root264]
MLPPPRRWWALQTRLVRLITQAAESGPADEGATPPDPRREACTLLALADGLTTHVLVGHLTAEEAEEVLHAHLVGLWERLGAGRPPRPSDTRSAYRLALAGLLVTWFAARQRHPDPACKRPRSPQSCIRGPDSGQRVPISGHNPIKPASPAPTSPLPV